MDYDHVMPPIVSQSNDHIYDRLLGKDGLYGHAHSLLCYFSFVHKIYIIYPISGNNAKT